MEEKQYIIATNLAKLRIAEQVLRSVFAGDEYGVNNDLYMETLGVITRMVEVNEQIVDQMEG